MRWLPATALSTGVERISENFEKSPFTEKLYGGYMRTRRYQTTL